MGDLIPFPNRRERWYTRQQLADHLQVSLRSIDDWVREGMPSERWGRLRRFRVSEVEDWLRRRSA